MPVLTLPDAALHYDIAGSGSPSVMLVHGGMCDHRDWERLVPLLVARHRVASFDLRGHGRSTGDEDGCTIEEWGGDLLALVDAAGLDRPVLVGHSMASRIVVEAAARAPDCVGGVVLLDGSRSHGGYAAEPGDVPPVAGGLDAVIDATIGPFADAVTRTAIHRRMSAASPGIMTACVDAMREWDIACADAAFAALAGAVPLLAIQSTYHDQATVRRSLEPGDESTPYLDFVREAVPDTRVEIVPDTGHFIMLERPETVARLVGEFVADIAAKT